MSILDKIKEMTGGIINPQSAGMNTIRQTPNNGFLQGSLGSYAQPHNQMQGGALPLYSNNISVHQPNFGQIRKPTELQFNPADIFNEGLEINPYGTAPSYPSNQYKEKQYLPYR